MNVFYFQWEQDLLMWFQNGRNGFCDFILPKITFLGNGGWFWILTTLLLLVFYKKDRRVGLNCFVSILLAALICNVILKTTINRARPCDIWPEIETIVSRPHDSSFPSGHTNASFAVATAIFLRNKKWGSAALVLAAVIAISRMYLFMHFPTDVLAGACNGVLWAIVAYYIVNLYYKKTGKSVDRF